MAYTYDDFTKAANGAGLMDSFDYNDLTLAQKYPEYGLSLVTLKRDLGNAKTNEQQLLVNEAINQLRKNYGSYWTGDQGDRTYAASYGSKISGLMDKLDNYGDYKSSYADQISEAQKSIDNYGSFEYGRENDYQNLLDKVVNQKKFEYDYETDPLFSSFKKAYLREGDRASANAMAKAAAATGGRQSSWSNYVGQQAANYYAAQLADKIPELRSQRLSEYNNEYENLLRAFSTMGQDRSTALTEYNTALENLRQNLATLRSLEETEYGRYKDDYSRIQGDLAAVRAQDESDYKRFLDALNAEYQRDRDAVTDAQAEFDNALKIYQLTGQVTGVLKDYLGAGGTVAGASGGGGSGGGGGYGSYTGSVSGTSAPAATTGKKVVTVPAYNSLGQVSTKVVSAERAQIEIRNYIDEAFKRGDINSQQHSAMMAENANPGSTNGQAELLAIQNDLMRGRITMEQATKMRQQVINEQVARVEAQKQAEAAAAAARIAAENAVREAAAKAAAQNGSAIHNNNGSSSSSSGSGTKAAQKANQAAKTGTSSSGQKGNGGR